MSNPPKQRGTLAETTVERTVNATLPGAAQRVALKGSHDQGDVHIWGGRIVVEVKSRRQWASPAQIEAWMGELERECMNVPACSVGVLVVKRPGSGPANAGDWLCYLRADEFALVAYSEPVVNVETAHAWVCVSLATLILMLAVLPGGAL